MLLPLRLERSKHLLLLSISVIVIHFCNPFVGSWPHTMEVSIPLELIAVLTLNRRLPSQIVLSGRYSRIKVSLLPYAIWNINKVIPPPLFNMVNNLIFVAANYTTCTLINISLISFKGIDKRIDTLCLYTLKTKCCLLYTSPSPRD